jgi:hypothetical protein
MYAELSHLADIDGILRRQDVLAAGGNDAAIARAIRAGAIVRVRNGAYALTHVWDSLDSRDRHLVQARVTYAASKTEVVVSHVSAALAHGAPVWDIPLDDVHLTRTDARGGRRESRVIQHRGILTERDIVLIHGVKVTSPTRTALDLTTITDLERSVPVMDHFLHTQRTSKRLLRRGSEAMKFWANTLCTDMAVACADGRRESLGESRTAVMLRGSGRPAPQPQYKIRDHRGKLLARVDFAWPELGVFLEFDGKVKYQKFLKEGEDVVDVVLREKKREEMICRLTGWRCIRLTWADLATPVATRRYVVSVLDGGPVHV